MKGLKKPSLFHLVSFPYANVELLAKIKSNYER